MKPAHPPSGGEAATPAAADLLSGCVHCGLCLEVCPTYQLTGDENNSPRGRLRLWREEADGRLPPDAWTDFYTAECVGCLACETACPDPECGTPEAGNCCFPHNNPNCNDQDCCDEVCDVDSFCCDGAWDQTCAAIANDLCSVCGGGSFCGDPEAGSCCNEHETVPFCSDELCCSFVCSLDESCCTSGWDTTCVKLAQAFCGCQ